MSQEKVLRTLESLGLSQSDAQVYVFLGKRGSQKAIDIAKALRMPKQQLYVVLKNLQSKAIVNATLERPARFSAVPFEKVLDLFVRARMEEAKRIQHGKNGFLSDWQSIAIGETADRAAKFTVLEGRNYIYSKLRQMIEETKNHLLIISTVPGLIRADQFGLLDAAFSHVSKSKIQLRFLTELSEQNVNALKSLLSRGLRSGLSFEGRVPELGLKLFTRIVIRDGEEAVFFITPETDAGEERKETSLWTNSKPLVNSFSAVFEEMWRNSKEVQKKIVELESGKPTPSMNVISDAQTAYERYYDALQSAEKEIIILTTAKGLIACVKGKSLVKIWAQRGVSVRIMAPITSENLEASQQLLRCFEVRHVPSGYLGTTIVDVRELFQFKNPPPEKEELRSLEYFENTFYTNDSEYIEKTRNMLDIIWRNAQAPSPITVESITNPNMTSAIPKGTMTRVVRKINVPTLIEEQRPLENLTEKDILNKILTAQRIPVKDPSKEIIRHYGTNAQAIIHPPPHFNLPDILFHIFHIDKNSSYGVEDSMIVMLWLETPRGYTYVPVAFVEDNPEVAEFWKSYVFPGSPVAQNVQLVKKDELQVRVHGNSLFAGWTIPIRLSSLLSLPPSCVLLEGYGNVKTETFTVLGPSGGRMRTEFNGFEAFVTFLHPSSKYSGPGTDGFLARECIMEHYPP